MKTVSEQLKDLGLQHGDMCEIEGVEGQCLIIKGDHHLRAENKTAIFIHNERVVCGWKAVTPSFTEFCMYRAHTKVLPKPELAPLPEAVEKILNGTVGCFSLEATNALREVFRAFIAETDRKIEAAKK
jgi:hypothetical protein